MCGSVYISGYALTHALSAPLKKRAHKCAPYMFHTESILHNKTHSNKCKCSLAQPDQPHMRARIHAFTHALALQTKITFRQRRVFATSPRVARADFQRNMRRDSRVAHTRSQFSCRCYLIDGARGSCAYILYRFSQFARGNSSKSSLFYRVCGV